MNGHNPSGVWPPKYTETTLDKPLPVPYLTNDTGARDIRVGRQLFVDDWLIRDSSLDREFHQPSVHHTPVFQPETGLELNDGECPCACPFNDGVFFDDQDGRYKMWYQSGWFDGTCYAESADGIHWNRREGRIIPRPSDTLRDGGSVWLDYDAENPAERYKMLLFFRKFPHPVRGFLDMPKHFHDRPGCVPPHEEAVLFASGDGLDWRPMTTTGPCGDNTTFHYDPFRKKWVFSLRTFSALDSRVRTRGYIELDHARFFEGAQWREKDIRFWSRTDICDLPDSGLGHYPQLYNLDATPYESLMLGLFGVFLGPPNFVCERTGQPKVIDLKLAFSRDGFHWHRPSYEPFLAASSNLGYLHACGGVCLVVGDELRFYFSTWSGESPKLGKHMYAGGSVGLATLRRDGFASLTDRGCGGQLVTHMLCYQGNSLFVNAVGEIRAELLDEEMRTLPGFSREDCLPTASDGTCQQLTWRGASMEQLGGRPLRIRFLLRDARLYSFWITSDAQGRSGGYMAAGGPGFTKGRDV